MSLDNNLKFIRQITSDKFYKELESLVRDHNLSYIDAIIHFCEQNDIEVETAASMVKSNQRIKSFLLAEGEDLNFIAKSPRLPI